MSILIGNHEFDGPVASFAEIPAAPGLYALLQEHNREFLLVDFVESKNMAKSLEKAASKLRDQMVVVLQCEDEERRRKILLDLVREFDYEDDEPDQARSAKRTETKSGVTMAI